MYFKDCYPTTLEEDMKIHQQLLLRPGDEDSPLHIAIYFRILEKKTIAMIRKILAANAHLVDSEKFETQ
jgi:hypothetical protein